MAAHTKLDSKQETLIAALLTEPTHATAAAKAGIGEATLHRWLKDLGFQAAYRQARREVLQGAVERLQGAVGQAVDTLRTVARDAAKDGDRVRAAIALLDHAFRGIEPPGMGLDQPRKRVITGTADVVQLLAERLAQLDAADLPTPEKARLTATLADALLRAIGVDVIDKRLEALQNVLLKRTEKP